MHDSYPPEIQRIVNRIAPGWPDVLEVEPGWYPLLARLDERLTAIAPNYVLQQCKTKFGSLCFYAEPSDEPWSYDENFNEAIRAAEWESIKTCEECGATTAGQYVFSRWVSTLCAEHAQARSMATDESSM